MDFLDFIRKVYREKKEFVQKGGEGSGWYAPPKGTHTEEEEGMVSLGTGSKMKIDMKPDWVIRTTPDGVKKETEKDYGVDLGKEDLTWIPKNAVRGFYARGTHKQGLSIEDWYARKHRAIVTARI